MAAGAPTVVHLKRRGGAEVVGCDTYIGRAMYQGGWRLPGSKWANPFRLSDGRFRGDRAAVLAAYEAHVRASPELMAALPELRGRRLGCWCKPLACHGDVLVRLYREAAAPARRAPPPAEAPAVAAVAAVAAVPPDWAALLDEWGDLGL